MQVPNPLDSATGIFNEALGCLMAHSVRAVVNKFRRHNLALDIIIIPDTFNRLNLENKQGRISFLRTRFLPEPHRMGRVSAMIIIHKDAGKNLARVCIAHELFHLICELEQFQVLQDWKPVVITPEVEASCDEFAKQLCMQHDVFNRNEEARTQFIYFPKDAFSHSLVDAAGRIRWHESFGLDPSAPFYKASAQ